MNEAIRTSCIKKWAVAARLPFAAASVSPFLLGCFAAYRTGYTIDIVAAGLGVLAAFLIHISCNMLGEATDTTEDTLTLMYGRTKFSGGTLAVVSGNLTKRQIYYAVTIALAIAAVLGVIIIIRLQDLILLLLGSIGIFCAVAYSLPPIRLAKRGLGELAIAVCFGWLPVAAGFACSSGVLPIESIILSLPAAITIFNVIFLNEFPDYEPDRQSGKRNLVVRMGRKASSLFFLATSILVALSLFAIWFQYKQDDAWFLFAVAPGALLALFLGIRVGLMSAWKDNSSLEPLMGLGVLLNLVAVVSTGALVW